MNEYHDGEVEIKYPAAKGAFRGESVGVKGKGTFEFEVVGGESEGMVVLRLRGLTFETENRADKAYRAMVGVKPSPDEDSDDSDTEDIDIV